MEMDGGTVQSPDTVRRSNRALSAALVEQAVAARQALESDEDVEDFVLSAPGSERGGAIQVDLKVKRTMEGKRLDQYLVDRFPA